MRTLSSIVVAAFAATTACHHSTTAARTSSTASAAAGAGLATRTAAPAKPDAVTAANIALGDSLFNLGACQRCHGKGGVGAANAPALNGTTWLQLKAGGFDEIVAIITNGVPAEAIKNPSHKFAMRARGGPMNLTDSQIQAVAAYVYTLSHK